MNKEKKINILLAMCLVASGCGFVACDDAFVADSSNPGYDYSKPVSIGGNAGPLGASCIQNSDCASGNCRKKQCIPYVSPSEVACDEDDECSDDEICHNGRCVSLDMEDICESDNDCTDGKICFNNECLYDSISPDAECVEDDDCGETGLKCVDGECVETITSYSMPTTDGTCSKKADCGLSEACVNTVCVDKSGESCVSKTQCGNGQLCVSKVCVDDGAVKSCSKKSECGTNENCVNKVCAIKTGLSCSQNTNCGNGQKCELGICVNPDPTDDSCTTDAQCVVGESCIQFKCVGGQLPEDECPVTCGDGQKCVEGKCVADDYCNHSEQCPGDQVCSQEHRCIDPVIDNTGYSDGSGPNCDAGLVSVSPSDFKSKCVTDSKKEIDEEHYYCSEGKISGRYCRIVPDESGSSLVTIQPNQRCTVEQLNPDKNTLRVHVIDVGQGDSIWIQTPTGHNVLIDGGDSGAFNKTAAGPIVTDYLTFHGFGPGSTFDAVFLTHPHSDHFGGMPNIFKSYRMANYIDPMELDTSEDVPSSYQSWIKNYVKKQLTDSQHIFMPAENKFNVDDAMPYAFFGDKVKAQYIYSSKKLKGGDPNSASIIFRIIFAGRAFLFTGDAEAAQEAEAVKTGQIQAEFLKVCHHGSNTSSSKAFLDGVWNTVNQKDRYALISSGRKPYSGTYIPNPEILERILTYVPKQNLLATSVGDDEKTERDASRDDNILVVVKPDGSYYACYSGTN